MCNSKPKTSLVNWPTNQSYLKVIWGEDKRVSYKVDLWQQPKCNLGAALCNDGAATEECSAPAPPLRLWLTESLSCQLIWFCSRSDNGLPIPAHSAGETGMCCTHTHSTHTHSTHSTHNYFTTFSISATEILVVLFKPPLTPPHQWVSE